MGTAPDARPILCAVLDGDALAPSPREKAAALFAAGVDWIQLRDRARPTTGLLALARALTAARTDAAARGAGAKRVIVNKRSDVALAAGADGIHLGLDAADARSVSSLLAGPGEGPDTEPAAGLRAAGMLGASIHGLDELEALIADRAPLAYVHLAPIWSPRSKPAERPELGLEVLGRAAAIAAKAGIAVLAQGGLDAGRAAAAIAAGASGIAVTGILGQTGDPAAAARDLRRALDRQGSRGGHVERSALRSPSAGDPPQ
jgi:thiamine-phosphate pyrophosphorylase